MTLKKLILAFVCLLNVAAIFAQPEDTKTKPTRNESGQTVTDASKEDPVRDDVYDRDLIKERRVLDYDHIREADVFWEKRVWRYILVNEKMNLPFIYPEKPFIKMVMDGASSGDLKVFSSIDDKFTTKLSTEEVNNIGGSIDTITTFNPDTYEEVIKVVRNEFNPLDVTRIRLKEIWFFDEETSRMLVRILGFAPIKDEKDDNGNVKYTLAMFWVYYPEARQYMARQEAFNPLNDAQRLSWEDIFEMRFFSSYIMKESNVYDRRVEDYKSGIDILYEAENIKNEIFNFEQDQWTP